MNLIQVRPVKMMKERKEGIKEDLKGIEVLFMVLIVYHTRDRCQIAQNDKVFAHWVR